MRKHEISTASEPVRPGRGKREQPGGGLGRKAGRIALWVLTCLLTLAAALVITVLVSLRMICSDAFPTAQQMFVNNILETGQLKFLASWFLSPEEIQAIVDQNSMEALDAQVDSSLIKIGGTGQTGSEDAG